MDSKQPPYEAKDLSPKPSPKPTFPKEKMLLPLPIATFWQLLIGKKKKRRSHTKTSLPKPTSLRRSTGRYTKSYLPAANPSRKALGFPNRQNSKLKWKIPWLQCFRPSKYYEGTATFEKGFKSSSSCSFPGCRHVIGDLSLAIESSHRSFKNSDNSNKIWAPSGKEHT